MPRELNWDLLRIFLAAARANSLRGASDVLSVNHATVRRGLAKLEEDLGTRLFERSPDGLALTQSGEELIPYATEIEQQTQEITRRVVGRDAIPSGQLVLSLPPSLAAGFLAPILASFSDKFPEIQVKVIATNKISDLGRSEADISIRVAYEVDDDVVGRRLVRFVVAAYATPEYIEKHPNITQGDGTGAHWIGWTDDHSWVKTSPLPKAKIRHVLPEIFMQVAAAAQGLGIIWAPGFLVDGHPELVRVPNIPVTPSRSIWLLLHGDLKRNARVRAFVDHAAEQILKDKSKYTT